jgi:Leucine-rich repeat (LRR) protein
MRKYFRVNRFISLRLVGNKTLIYIGGKLFDQCQKIIVNLPLNGASNYESIDEFIYNDGEGFSIDALYETPGSDSNFYKISPQTEFWAHCSNIQAWADNNYDTKLLSLALSFPMLKKLVELGDETAKKVFKDEIAKRFASRYPPVVKYLVLEEYLDYLNSEELEVIVSDMKKVELEGTSLDCIPEYIYQARILEELDLADNYIEEVGDQIKNLKNLISLNLWQNQVNYLSRNIGHLKKLKYLILTDNKLNSIPSTIGCMNSLLKPYLGYNYISELPSSISKLRKLKELVIYNNELKFLPESIKFLGSVEMFDLNKNHIRALPNNIGFLNSLKKLLISNNELSELPNSFDNLKNLEILSLSANKFSEIPYCISRLQSLKQLYISGNRISHISEEFNFPAKLGDLDLSDNKLSKLPKNILKLKFLEDLVLYGNPLVEIPNFILELPRLKYLHLDKIQISLLNEEMVRTLKKRKINVYCV